MDNYKGSVEYKNGLNCDKEKECGGAVEYALQWSGNYMVRTAQQRWQDGYNMPEPVSLFKNMWIEGELCCLFGVSNCGKTILATQIAESIARDGRRVMYVDCELSDKQFQIRGATELSDNSYALSDNFMIMTPCNDGMPQSPEDNLRHIILTAVNNNCKIIIIDNITVIANDLEKGISAKQLMFTLKEYKNVYNLSILLLAHTPKHVNGMPLNITSISGSMNIANFLDAAFGIGIDKNCAESGRYIKQVKVRSSMCEYGANNVLLAHIEKEEGQLTKFVFDDTADESSLLSLAADNASVAANIQQQQKEEQIKQMLSEGKTRREICSELRVGSVLVSRIKNHIDEMKTAAE